MTNEEYIQSLPRRELARLLLQYYYEPDYDYDYDDNLYECGEIPVVETSDGYKFYWDEDAAIQHECWWLAQEHKEDD
jgi:hypothetical protein